MLTVIEKIGDMWHHAVIYYQDKEYEGFGCSNTEALEEVFNCLYESHLFLV